MQSRADSRNDGECGDGTIPTRRRIIPIQGCGVRHVSTIVHGHVRTDGGRYDTIGGYRIARPD